MKDTGASRDTVRVTAESKIEVYLVPLRMHHTDSIFLETVSVTFAEYEVQLLIRSRYNVFSSSSSSMTTSTCSTGR
jgi:hypothetical protein